MQPIPASEQRDERINVLEIIGSSTLGGMENYITNFIAHLPPDEFKITCICPNESIFTTRLRELGVDGIYITPIADDPPWHSIQMAVEVARLHKADILHGHMPKAHLLAGLAGCLVHKPVLATVHGMDVTALELGITRAVGSHLVMNCQEAYAQALALGVPAHRVNHVRNGVDTSVYKPGLSAAKSRQDLGIAADATVVGFVGRLEHIKGPDLFIRAAAAIHRSMPDVQFVVAGQGAMSDELKALCGQLQLTEHVHFVGWCAQSVDIYSALDLLIHSSRSDGTSLVLLEAMACGCPSIGLSVGGIREIIDDMSTGYLLEAGDWEGIARHAVTLLKDPALLETMGAAARQRIVEFFDVETNTSNVANLLRRIANAGSTEKTISTNSEMNWTTVKSSSR